jgi:hypothetical protein
MGVTDIKLSSTCRKHAGQHACEHIYLAVVLIAHREMQQKMVLLRMAAADIWLSSTCKQHAIWSKYVNCETKSSNKRQHQK